MWRAICCNKAETARWQILCLITMETISGKINSITTVFAPILLFTYFLYYFIIIFIIHWIVRSSINRRHCENESTDSTSSKGMPITPHTVEAQTTQTMRSRSVRFKLLPTESLLLSFWSLDARKSSPAKKYTIFQKPPRLRDFYVDEFVTRTNHEVDAIRLQL